MEHRQTARGPDHPPKSLGMMPFAVEQPKG